MHSRTSLKRSAVIVASLVGSLLLPIIASPARAQETAGAPGMPKPREVSKEEEQDITKRLGTYFQKQPGKEVQFLAAGAYRFINTPRFSYMERTDTGSVAFENPNYGTGNTRLEATAASKEVLLPRLDEALRHTGLNTEGMRFSHFQDEFAAAAEPSKLSRDFDPRKAGIHVARTAVYNRQIEGVPIFSSELIVGLMPEGDIGRFRMHSPKIDPDLIATAKGLQKAVRAGTWKVPKILRRKDTKILDISAGVGHSGFADPEFKAAAVVKVLYRTRSPDRKYPLQTTGYKYFDQKGEEIRFHAFPRLPGTPKENKPALEKGY